MITAVDLHQLAQSRAAAAGLVHWPRALLARHPQVHRSQLAHTSSGLFDQTKPLAMKSSQYLQGLWPAVTGHSSVAQIQV